MFAGLIDQWNDIATDLLAGETVTFDRGPIDKALMASMSVAGLAPPIPHGNRLLVDGSVSNDLPVDAVRERGADFVIAVDLSGLARDDAVSLDKESMSTGAAIARALNVQRKTVDPRTGRAGRYPDSTRCTRFEHDGLFNVVAKTGQNW